MTTDFPTDRWTSIVADRYGLVGRVSPLPGYTDTNIRLETDEGQSYVIRMTPPPADPARSDFVASVLAASSIASINTPNLVIADDGSHHVITEDGFLVRVLTFIEGTTFEDAGMPARAARSIGAIAGEMVRVLASVTEPVAPTETVWDLRRAEATITSLFGHLRTDHERSLVSAVLDRFRAIDVTGLPLQVIHGDINPGNLVVDGDTVTGLLDFGDTTRTFRIAELAIACAYTALDTDDPLSIIADVCAGYRAEVTGTDAEPSPAEAEALGDLILTRLATSVAVAAARTEANPHWHTTRAPAWDLLERLVTGDTDAVCAAITAAVRGEELPPRTISTRPMIGTALRLAYDNPLSIASGNGVYLSDHLGRRYLDGVNNVCHVGHANPRVVAALAEAAATLNTNTRYLHPDLDRYASRLVATLPDGLDTVFVVNSGSEANELAIRLARTATGKRGVACIEDGYHGNTSTLIDVSPYKFLGPGGEGRRPWVTVLPTMDPFRDPSLVGAGGYARYRQLADDLLAETDPAALILEALPGCGGQVVPERSTLAAAYDAARARGTLVIADEVQTGLGRVGEAFWAFDLFAVVPDIVTIGKPAGNGHPLGAVVTTRAIADAFDNGMEYFNTFGGNPVSAAVGNAVLDVIEDEQLQHRAAVIGRYLLDRLAGLASAHTSIVDVRGVGLFVGVELGTAGAPSNPDPALAHGVVQDARHAGVLLSTDGPGHNVIKIKPPLVFREQHADRLVDTIDKALGTS